jgi:hypothetical protein
LEYPLVVEILERIHQQLHVDRRITFVWVPSHIGIAGNTAVDAVAKASVIKCRDPSHRLQTTDIESHKKLLATVLELRYQQQALQNTARNQIIYCQPSAM